MTARPPLEALDRLVDLVDETIGQPGIGAQIGHTGLRADREPGWDAVGTEYARHLGEIGSLAAEQRAHLARALGEAVNELGCGCARRPSLRSLGAQPGGLSPGDQARGLLSAGLVEHLAVELHGAPLPLRIESVHHAPGALELLAGWREGLVDRADLARVDGPFAVEAESPGARRGGTKPTFVGDVEARTVDRRETGGPGVDETAPGPKARGRRDSRRPAGVQVKREGPRTR